MKWQIVKNYHNNINKNLKDNLITIITITIENQDKIIDTIIMILKVFQRKIKLKIQ